MKTTHKPIYKGKITWTIGIPYAEMASPFTVGDIISHWGKRVKIASITRNGLEETIEAFPTNDPVQIWHNGKFIYAK